MIRIFAFVVALLVSSSAWAQEVPLQIASLGKVFREGMTTTASYNVPADIRNTYSEVRLSLNLNDVDYEAPSTRVTLRIYRLIPATGLWQQMSSTTKVGGQFVEDGIVNPPVQMGVSLDAFAGYTVRAEVETATRIRVGIVVELIAQ
jgi:hypothetical protein